MTTIATTAVRRYSELVAGFELPTVQLMAVNTSDAGIHVDATAAKHGFRSGLVPGVTVYTYVNRVLVSYFGAAWLSTGRTNIRFARPLYHGDAVVCRAVVTRRTDKTVEFEIWGENGEGEQCARGTASFPLLDSAAPPVGLPFVVDAAAAVAIPAATPEQVTTGVPFQPRVVVVDRQMNADYVERIGDAHLLYQRFAHPGIFLGRALGRGIAVGQGDLVDEDGVAPRGPAGIHVASEITAYLPALVDHAYTVYGIYLEHLIKNANSYYIFDIAITDEEGRCVYTAHMTRIYHIGRTV